MSTFAPSSVASGWGSNNHRSHSISPLIGLLGFGGVLSHLTQVIALVDCRHRDDATQEGTGNRTSSRDILTSQI